MTGAAVRGGGAKGIARRWREGSVEVGCRRVERLGRGSARVVDVAARFGIPLEAREVTILETTRVPLGAGRIVLLLGPSGSGKSSAMGEIERQFPIAHNVQRVRFAPDAAVIDQVAPWETLSEAAGLLTSCGLSEPRLWVRTFEVLSEGEKFRARLARAIAMNERAGRVAPVLCDEFCSILHRRAARAISFNLRKLVTRRGLCVVVASSNADIVDDLRPDVLVRLKGDGGCEVEERGAGDARFGLLERLKIVAGGKRDYDAFAAMHYRASDELGFVDKVFVLREDEDGEALGIVVYSHSPLELSLRNQATNGWFVRNPQRVNRQLRILRRLVIHPDVRGCGLGHHLVAQTMPRLGTDYVECLAAMGEFNPVFEKAGMERIGQYELTQSRKDAKGELDAMDLDVNSPEFAVAVARRPRVRHIVARVVREWYQATTGGGRGREARQSPAFLAQTFRGLIALRPVYYLWKRRNVSVEGGSKHPNGGKA